MDRVSADPAISRRTLYVGVLTRAIATRYLTEYCVAGTNAFTVFDCQAIAGARGTLVTSIYGFVNFS